MSVFIIMKYIITKKQSTLLSESDHMLWVKRRMNARTLREYIDEAESNYPMLCDDFKNDYEYINEVINDAVSDFLTTHEEMFTEDNYDEINEIITNMCEKWFGDELKEIYKITCIEE